MVIGIESINAGTLLLIGVIFLALGITFLIISLILNKKLEKRPIKVKQPLVLKQNEIRKPDLPFIEEIKNQEQIDIVTGKEIPKIIIDRNNQEKVQEENIKPLEITLEKEVPIKLTTDIIELDQNKENELVEETNVNEELINEELEEISLNELEEELPTEEPKEQPEFIEIEDESQKEIQKSEPVILKPKEVTLNTTKPEKGKEQEINLEDTEEEIELL